MRGTPRKEDLFKLPNILCYVRILLVPVFVFIFLNEWYWQSALVVVVATATDVFDGWIARRYNMVSDWGKFIDPVADKLMQFAMLTVTIFKVPAVLILVCAFLFKEIILLVIGIWIYHNDYNLPGAIWCGKLCTVVLDLTMLLFIAAPMSFLTVRLTHMLIGVVLSFLGLSFVIYLNEYKKLYLLVKQDRLNK